MSDKENIVSDVTESSAEEVSAVQSPAADVSEAAEDTASIAVTDAEAEEACRALGRSLAAAAE